MALITCPDCSNQISDRAPACPKCGRPVSHEAALRVAVTKGAGVGSGVKIGFGMFVVLPMLLLLGSCAMCGMLMELETRTSATAK